MKTAFLTTLLACAALAACSSSDLAIGTRGDAGPDDASTPPAPPAASSNDAAATPPAKTDAGPFVAVGTGSLELDVVPVNAGTKPLPGILAVVWAQLNDDGPDPEPQVAYSVPFAGTETHVSIPLSAVAAPVEAVLLCKRACTDEAMCPCLADPKVSLGLIVVIHDANGNGIPDVTNSDSTTEKMLGISRSVLSWSEKAHSAPAPGMFEQVFPDGIRAGAHLYDTVRPNGGLFDRLGFPAPGATFKLPVCNSLDNAVCQAKGPNLT